MNPEELKELKELTSQKFKELEGKMVSGESYDALKADFADLNEKMGTINDAAAAEKAAKEQMQEQLDALETKMKEYNDNKSKILSPLDFFKEELKNSEDFDRFKANTRNGIKLGQSMSEEDRVKFEKSMFDMIHKATVLQSSHWTGNVAPVDRISDVAWALPHEQMRVRSLLTVGTTDSNVVDFVRTTSTRNAAAVTEGASKPQSEEAFAAVQANVQVLAHHFRISRQALSDYGQTATYLSQEGIAGLKDEEDDQILNGSGSAPNLNGIITQASTTFSGGTSSDTDLDTLLKAVYKLKTLNYRPNAILVPPAKMQDIKLSKDTTGQYIFPNFLPTGLANPVSVDGVPVIEHTKVPADTFLVGDFMKAGLFDREAANVRFYEEDQDNAIKNLVTVLIEERAALAVFRTDAFCTATFTDAQSILT